jgi:hypothetical protein
VARSRMKRWGWIALVAVIGVVAAVFIDAERRRRQAGAGTLLDTATSDVQAGPAELAKRFEDPNVFREFCQKLDAKYRAMNERYKSLQHRSRQRIKRLDEFEKVIADEELEEIVDFPGGKERRRLLKQKDLKTGSVIQGESESQKTIATFRAPYQYPFLPDSTWDDFSYQFAGVEMVAGKPVVKVEFTPNPPFGRKVIGAIWADAETGQPVRFAGRWHKPTGFAHKSELVSHYGPSENGEHQLRRIETDSAGGALFIYHRYVIIFDIDDYRAPEGK